MAESPVRDKLVQLMHDTVNDEERNHTWTYRAVRPMRVPRVWYPGNHVIGDCSKGCQYLCRWADAPDPMGNGWNDWGNSSTIWATLEHAHEWEAEPGDIFTFGYSTGEKHAAMVYQKGSDPLLWNFGAQWQPALRRLSAEKAAHRGMTVTLCKLPVAPPVPTPEDILRERTTFYAWVAWRLGEGPWKRHGKLNKAVRPNVPWRIPLSWWRRYAVFLRNRNKPTG